MKHSLGLSVLAALMIGGCSNGQDPAFQAQREGYDAFARSVYEAVAWQNVDAMVELCAQPGDLSADGDELVPASDSAANESQYRRRLEVQTQNFLAELAEAGDITTMRLAQVGKPIGLMAAEADFVGNMFLIVELSGSTYAIEIGSSMQSSQRGRLLMAGEILALKDLDYYHQMAQMF